MGAAALAAGLLPERFAFAQKPMRILMLGGTGFIGPHRVHASLARGHQVSMLNRGRRAPTQNAGDFAKVEALRGDRSQPDAYASLAGKSWDVVIDTANSVPWTREAATALKGATARFLYVSSTGAFWPYQTRLAMDSPAGTWWCVQATSWAQAISPTGSGIGPSASRAAAVRDLAEWMVRLIEHNATGTFNAVGPAAPQTLAQFIDGQQSLASAGTTYTWIDDYEWLKKYPLR